MFFLRVVPSSTKAFLCPQHLRLERGEGGEMLVHVAQLNVQWGFPTLLRNPIGFVLIQGTDVYGKSVT